MEGGDMEELSKPRSFSTPPKCQFKYDQSYKNVCSKTIISFQALQSTLYCREVVTCRSPGHPPPSLLV